MVRLTDCLGAFLRNLEGLPGLAEHRSALSKAFVSAAQPLQEAFRDLVGPDHVPPPGAVEKKILAARPPFLAYHWRVRDWQCLRMEERTEVYTRPSPYWNDEWQRPALRNAEGVDSFMKWMSGVSKAFGLQPTPDQVRMIVYPGKAYTFVAWKPVPARDKDRIHPGDCDNLFKPLGDGFEVLPTTMREEDREFGIYLNDSQIVDLCVFRAEQEGEAPIDRIPIRAQHRRVAKERWRKIKAGRNRIFLEVAVQKGLLLAIPVEGLPEEDAATVKDLWTSQPEIAREIAAEVKVLVHQNAETKRAAKLARGRSQRATAQENSEADPADRPNQPGSLSEAS